MRYKNICLYSIICISVIYYETLCDKEPVEINRYLRHQFDNSEQF